MITPPKLILFDCDGVLVDTEPLTNKALSENLTRHGFPISPEACLALFVGGTMQSAMEEVRRRGGTLPDTWLDEIYDEMFRVLSQGVDVYDGVFSLLDQLETRGVQSCIVSNGPMAKMGVSLAPSGLLDRFSGRIYSGHDYVPKPAPAMLLAALKDFGVTPSEAVMIDDSASGCRAAKAAGIRCLGFAPAGDGAALAAEGAEVISSMKDVARKTGLA